MKQKSICLLICFYGKWPWYFEFFLHTCKTNPSVDFFLITDIRVFPTNLPKNVLIIHKSLEDLNNTFSEKLGFQVATEKPFKLCDLRPAYGYLFSDIVKNYDFWGYCDIDVILGKIRHFLTPEVLTEYDIIGARSEFLTGYFAIYRNTKTINLLFKESKDFQTVFQSSQYCGFDECSNLCYQLMEGASLSDLSFEWESITHVIKKVEKISQVKALFEHWAIEGVPSNLAWNNGVLTYKEFEVLLYHLMWMKNLDYLLIPDWEKIPRQFFINNRGLSLTNTVFVPTGKG